MKVSVLKKVSGAEIPYAFEGSEIWHRGRVVPGVCKIEKALGQSVPDEIVEELRGAVVSIIKDDSGNWIAPLVKFE